MAKEEPTQDLRVTRTIALLKDAFRRLIADRKLSKITVSDLADAAPMNRRTFYTYYRNINELMMDVERDYADQTIERVFASGGGEAGLAGGIYAFYQDMNTDDPAMQKLLYDSECGAFFRKYTDDVISSDFFAKYYRDSKFPSLTKGFMDSIVGIYMQWHDDPERKVTLKELARTTADLIENGLSGMTDH